MVQLLHGLEAPAASTFALRGVDHLPCLVVALFHSVTGLVKIKEHGNEHGEAAEIFEHFDERPSAQRKRYPLPNPFECKERFGP